MLNKKFPFLLVFILVTFFLLNGCTYKENVNSNKSNKNISTENVNQNQFTGSTKIEKFNGEKGETKVIKNNQIVLEDRIFNDGLAHFYNTELGDKTVYFFIVKDENGIYRAAANACQVCFDSRTGFRQEGDFMVCNTCGNKYPLNKIATEKGGCNPAPINPNLKVEDNLVILEQADLEQVSELF